MTGYCEVALPVPLDRTFTYALRLGQIVERGMRVIAPFRNEKLIGVVTAVMVEPPPDVEIKSLEAVLDDEPLLSEQLLALAEWMASYYLAPLGEVLRGMLPLTAEVRRTVYYRITDLGRDVLAKQLEGAEESHRAARGEDDEGVNSQVSKSRPGAPGLKDGTKRRGKLSRDEQNLEVRVLRKLAEGESVKVSTLRTATAATLQILAGMVRKKWIARETAAAERDARRTERFAVLIDNARLPKLTANQESILAELAAAGGELPLAELRKKDLPSSTLQTLVRRGLVRIDERMSAFRLGGIKPAEEVFKLNAPQMDALAAIVTALGKFKPLLLFGVTGSGKTAVYLEGMKRVLDRGMSAILLVPEIGLTPQTVGLLDAAFGEHVALLHSALTPEERSEQWRRIRRGEARIVVGTRSAIFAPVQNLGLILVDEEHDQSYKQEETPRYNARDVAVMRAKLANAVVVMGSATPSLESWQNSVQGKYERIEIRERVMNRPLPAVELIDMRREFQESGREDLFSRSLIQQTSAALDRGEQAIILLNRRGYSFAIICRACGNKLECDNCAIALTHHKPVDGSEIAREGQRLECHYCGARKTVPARCPKCDSEHLYYLGAGSQQGEERLGEIFPTARIGRMDRDTVRGRYDLERLLARLHAGEINLLVGTQMIAKGHDIHGVTLVGVVGCDHALSMPDFRAAERVFQLMTQVSGRAGRGDLPGRVVVQTYYPDHYAIQAAAAHDYMSFAERELKYRRWMHYPPFGVLANVLVQSQKLEEAAGWSSILGKHLVQNQTGSAVRVLGPCTAPIARIKGVYRFHMILKAASRKALNEALRKMLAHADEAGVPRRNVIVDVDALRLM
jgi:primosomal protein N' (replication factor Y)